MFGSNILDVVIGLAFTFFLLSIVASAGQELLSQAISWRSKTLKSGIGQLLADPTFNGLAGQVYANPLVSSLGTPSYLKNTRFADALMESLSTAEAASQTTIATVLQGIEALPAGERRRRNSRSWPGRAAPTWRSCAPRLRAGSTTRWIDCAAATSATRRRCCSRSASSWHSCSMSTPSRWRRRSPTTRRSETPSWRRPRPSPAQRHQRRRPPTRSRRSTDSIPRSVGASAGIRPPRYPTGAADHLPAPCGVEPGRGGASD